jgi:hypothetical protein
MRSSRAVYPRAFPRSEGPVFDGRVLAELGLTPAGVLLDLAALYAS